MKPIKFSPVIKWSGSKRSQCNEIIKRFPQNINTYYEPFCGGCSMLYRLIKSNINVKNYMVSDINSDLIAIWNIVKDNPNQIYLAYIDMWNELNYDNDLNRKRDYFCAKRDEYNKTHDPLIFFFIMRTTTNGMPRYNNDGKFNNSFHITRNGIEPKNLIPILNDWKHVLNSVNLEFRSCSYTEIIKDVKSGDFLYLDPPYFNTKGMYYGGINFDAFFSNLSELNTNNIKYALSFDGTSGNEDNTYAVPQECYKMHLYIKSGNSSFKRTIGNDNNAMVYESLYLN